VAVSGGADSLATALLVRDWAQARGGAILALVVDHALRAGSGAEARQTLERLASRNIPATLITLRDLARGPGLAARARAARHEVLEAECAARGILHLVFGHHAGDQAETICMRLLAHSGLHGLAGMAALVETPRVRRLRPLLATLPSRLRATLRAAGLAWVEDPSNADPSQQRARLRALRAQLGAGAGAATRALLLAAAARGAARARDEAAIADELARKAAIHPQGFALLAPGAVSAASLAALIAMVGGAAHRISAERLHELAAQPRSATMAGVRLLPAGRLGPGWLLVREAASLAGPCAARKGAIWDGRFRMTCDAPPPAGIGAEISAEISTEISTEISSWGDDVPRGRGELPAAILRTLPVLRRGGAVVGENPVTMRDFLFAPRFPAAPAPFFPLPAGG
jgi:tRNA(Ile)-lysidine synthase